MGDVLNILLLQNTLRTATPVVLAALGIGFFLRFAVTEIPFLVDSFQTVRLTAGEWGSLLLLAAAPMLAHELLIGLERIFRIQKKR